MHTAGAWPLKPMHPPAVCPCVHFYMIILENWKIGNSMHLPGAQVLKLVHPATKMCTYGAGCTLNFEHCEGYFNASLK